MSGNDDVKSMKCAACGGDITKSYRIVDEDEEIPIARCVSCGTEYDQYTGEYYRYFADDFTYDKDNSILKLGLKGVLDGIEYEIIGRIRMQDEDEYERSTWDEWLAVSSDGVYHYFVEEDGEIRSYEEYVPQSINLEASDSHIEFEGKKISKDEAYIGRIVYFEGELTWLPEIGEAVTCYDFKKDGYKFTIEQSENEVSITRGDKLTYREIIDAFGDDEDRKLYENTMKKRREFRNKALVYLAGALLALAFSIYSCSTSEEIKGVMAGKKAIADNKIITDKRSVNYFSQILYGPFEISGGESLYDVDVFIDERVQRLYLEWQSFRFMLIKEDRLSRIINNNYDAELLKGLFTEIDARKEPIESYVITGDFWDEKGVDSDGPWHESDLNASASFVLKEDGKYYAYLELYSNKPRKIDSVKFRVQKVKSYRYMIAVTVLLLILVVINRGKSSLYNELPFEIADE